MDLDICHDFRDRRDWMVTNANDKANPAKHIPSTYIYREKKQCLGWI